MTERLFFARMPSLPPRFEDAAPKSNSKVTASRSIVRRCAGRLPGALARLWVIASLTRWSAHAAGVAVPDEAVGSLEPAVESGGLTGAAGVSGGTDGTGAEPPRSDEPAVSGKPDESSAGRNGFSDPFTPSQGAFGLPAAPSGFAGWKPGGLPFGSMPDESRLYGFHVTTTLSGTYTSSIQPNGGAAATTVAGSGQDDFVLRLGANLSYASRPGKWTFGGSFSGSYDQYFNHSSLSAFNPGVSLLANYNGGKLSATINVGVSRNSGSNIYYSSAFVQQTSANASLGLRYRISPKTSLQGNINKSFSTASGGQYSNTGNFNAGLSAMWRYSALTELGPGIRITQQAGGVGSSRISIGPTLSLNYKLGVKTTVNAQVGLDFETYQGGGPVATGYQGSGSGTPLLSTSIGMNYQASKLWGMNLTIYRDAQASPWRPAASAKSPQCRSASAASSAARPWDWESVTRCSRR